MRQKMMKKPPRFDFSKKTYIMGILNATPDSFSDGGKYNEQEHAIQHALQMVHDGADMIDVGGESTRPGSVQVSEEEEIKRVIPIISAISERVSVPISIDTYKSEVAKQAIEAGATIINDVWGAKKDPNMAKVAAQYGVRIIVMHNRDNMDYNDIIEDMKKDLQESINICLSAGVKKDNIIIDPGIGFAKTYEDNLEVMNRLEELNSLGYPILLATSRKSLIAKTLDLPVDERVEGTGATVCLGITKGCNIVRVHDVLPISRMVKMMDAMVRIGAE